MKYLFSIIITIPFLFFACKSTSTSTSESTSTSTTSTTTTTTSTTSKDDKFKTRVGEEVPQFSLKAIDGKTYSMKKFKGKTVWLNFFATWCGPCLEEIPELNKLAEKNEDVIFISIGRGHTTDELIPFAEKKNMTYIVAADPDKEIYNLFADKYIPRNYLINKKGKIIHQEYGYDKGSFKELVSIFENNK